MSRRGMRVVGVVLFCALAGCSIDKTSTADALIAGVEKQLDAKLSGSGKDCLRSVINGLSTDELKALNQAKASKALTNKFLAAERQCIPALDPLAPSTSTSTTTSPGGSPGGTASTGSRVPKGDETVPAISGGSVAISSPTTQPVSGSSTTNT